MNLLRFLLQSSRTIVLSSTLAGATAAFTGVALIALIQRELAREASGDSTMVWAFAALCVVSVSARVIGQVGMIKLGQRAVADLSIHVVRRTLELPLSAFEALDTSGLLAVLTEDVVLIANALVGIPHLCINVPIVMACTVYLIYVSPLIFVCGVVFAGPAVLVSVALSARGVKELRRARERQNALIGHFRTVIDGFRELKLHRGRRAAFLADSLDPTMKSTREEMVRGLTSFAVAEGWGQLAFCAFIAVVLFAIPQLQPIGRPTLVSAILIVLFLMGPLDIVLTWMPVLGRARVSLQKVQDLIPQLKQRGDDTEPRFTPSKRLAFRDRLSLERVTFTYRDGHDGTGFVLEPVDLTLNRGEIVILAGGNGSGKTTLVKLIAGLYKPLAGTIRLDGRVITDVDREAYRQLFSVAFADGHVFPDFLGLESDLISNRAAEGLGRLGLSPHVSVEGRSFKAPGLSLGQRRRLALLGVWLEDRPICIFDEWAANQDQHFKRVFYDKLLPEMRRAGKAILVISHDESHFEVADRIIRLQDGRLVDESPLLIDGEWAGQF